MNSEMSFDYLSFQEANASEDDIDPVVLVKAVKHLKAVCSLDSLFMCIFLIGIWNFYVPCVGLLMLSTFVDCLIESKG